jgi:hypothetical protein
MTLLANSVGGPGLTWSTTGTVTPAALVDGQLYRFSVVAVNAIGPSAFTNNLGIYAA